jgi:hypothetical protein
MRHEPSAGFATSASSVFSPLNLDARSLPADLRKRTQTADLHLQ